QMSVRHVVPCQIACGDSLRDNHRSRPSVGCGQTIYSHILDGWPDYQTSGVSGVSHWEEPNSGLTGSTFNLRVQVADMLSGLPLSQALVELFINHTMNSSAVSAEDGGAWLRAPYPSRLPLTVAASRAGYISTLMSCKANRTPIFSSLTVWLLRMTQGNIWLFEDSVLITRKTPGGFSQPVVRFPQRLLNLSHSRNAFPGQLGDIVPPWCPGSFCLDVPGKPLQGVTQEAS
uniref:FAM171 N-terminal domain-containing protein n=1 Tax=Nothobranchius furzeri TaxID=105023 RepID=A0A8C6ME07_NOTFU